MYDAEETTRLADYAERVLKQISEDRYHMLHDPVRLASEYVRKRFREAQPYETRRVRVYGLIAERDALVRYTANIYQIHAREFPEKAATILATTKY